MSVPPTPHFPSVRRAASALAAAVALWLLGAAPAVAEDLVVVVGRDVTVENLTPELVGRIYRGEVGFLGDAVATPVDYGPQVAFRDKFLKRVLRTDAPRFSAYWSREVFRNGRVPPLTVASVEDALARVAERPGALAYVRATDVAGPAGERVRVVLELPCRNDHALGMVAPVPEDRALGAVTPTPTATRG